MSQRTNSLAFAKSDCHTCKALHRVCDRQRPICTTCQNAGDECKGFQTRLIWEGSDLPSRRGDDSRRRHGIECRPVPSETATATATESTKAKRAGHTKIGSQRSTSPQKRGREFSFVNWPPKRRKKHSRKGGEESQQAHASPVPKEEDASDAHAPGKTVADPASQKPVPPVPNMRQKHQDSLHISADYTSIMGSADLQLTPTVQTNNMFRSPVFDNWLLPDTAGVEELPLFSTDATLDGMPNQGSEQHPSATLWLMDGAEEDEDVEGTVTGSGAKIQSEWPLRPNSPSSMALSMATLHKDTFDIDSFTILASIPPRVQYISTADQFSVLLDRYDQEFCTYPVTNDLDINPFRYRRETSRGSKHLLHAIIAIACHHQNSYSINSSPPAEFYQHKNQAAALYKAAVENPEIQAQGLEALDTLLALWCIDTVESALNPWRAHLSHAYSLLELAGGIDVWSLSFRWDAVVALLSRRPCVMPYTYFEAVLQWEVSQFWTFFELIGCPRELLVPLMQLAHLAGQSKTKGSMGKAMKAIVTEIEGNLRSYQPPDNEAVYDLELEDDESLQQARDQYHSCEAIRYSLLIYALQVFQDDEGETTRASVSTKLRYLSRVALDHVCSIRPSSPTQKQLLLPIFLAGAQTTFDRHKNFIREYCRQWFETFGYHMFTSVIGILEEVWAGQDEADRGPWWGEVVDRWRQAGHGDVDFCFG
ncbi:hypothetical protein A1O1_06205 [Capronia coronata CBS 617.96]|uniref:Zn(2)-C6 fungal-type domain-containing protein n=1 Tax=Capronia coronata CBS 617.96 TaxID=1182541 RepID=W9Y9E4_9EURO|nr:uncharacterized protein A1O1_06205 [Capronia coronata CBS 617.96]EXJ85836.1 hypothetical protein A1O1_06205 [Capronia coronata CBS 617.96]